MLFAYFGPETMLPLTSILAAAGGFFLMFGRQTVKVVKLLFRFLALKTGLKQPASKLHSARADRAGSRSHGPARDKYRPMSKDVDTDKVHS